ncbi:MAG: FAA hydrolase family protein [Chloroflexi bacterium]|nr:MAG: FAA hydrolase family protein [Chloroflexota bacterium]
MKLVTLKTNGGSVDRLGRVDGQTVIPFDYPGGMLNLIRAGQDGLAAAQAAAGPPQPYAEDNLAAPLVFPSKVIAIGKNYADHAKETNSDIPDRPITFTKFTTSITGPRAEVSWDPALTTKVDYEAELAVIIGKTARNVPESDALDYVFGYTCANDVSARDLQFGDGQWVRGKSLDTFCPLGPWIVTADEIPNPQTLDIRGIINGQLMQHSHTSKMIFSVPYLIAFLSRAFTLLPGDIILSGTPDGVGAFREPPLFMKDGDEMVVEIERVGRLVNTCRTK